MIVGEICTFCTVQRQWSVVLICWNCMPRNPSLSITARAEGRYTLWTWKRIGLRHWRRRLKTICCWSLDWGALEFPGRREIRDIRVEESFGMIYLVDGERTLGGSRVAEVDRWIEWCGNLEGGAGSIRHVPPSRWGSIFDHYSCLPIFMDHNLVFYLLTKPKHPTDLILRSNSNNDINSFWNLEVCNGGHHLTLLS